MLLITVPVQLRNCRVTETEESNVFPGDTSGVFRKCDPTAPHRLTEGLLWSNADFIVIRKQDPKTIYRWPSVSAGCASADSTKHGSKILEKKNPREFEKAKLEFAMLHQLFINTQHFTLYLQLST